MSLLLNSCDRSSALGCRDAAIVTVLVRLGLRAGEVAASRLADINWRRGEIVVRGKGGRQDILPLPADVGEAIAGWLQRGRPPDAGGGAHTISLRPAVFRPSSAGLAAALASRWLDRIASGTPHPATQILRQGGSLEEISQVLRHSRLATTAVYAKVDMPALALVAQPWPGGQS